MSVASVGYNTSLLLKLIDNLDPWTDRAAYHGGHKSPHVEAARPADAEQDERDLDPCLDHRSIAPDGQAAGWHTTPGHHHPQVEYPRHERRQRPSLGVGWGLRVRLAKKQSVACVDRMRASRVREVRVPEVEEAGLTKPRLPAGGEIVLELRGTNQCAPGF